MDRALLAAFRRRVVAVIEEDLAREEAAAECRRAVVLPAVSKAVAEARAAGDCRRVWLFGSFAWGEPGERSDVDLLVEGCADPDALAAAVWRVADRPVHVVELERAPATLVERALREGSPL
jgi:predicted nucleotidyltransferase